MNIVEIAERLQDVGIQAITIHGRTRMQMYSGSADWSLVGAVRRNPRMYIPVVGNGDVDSPEIAATMFERYGVDGIMIGRGAIGCPWIFSHIKHFLKTHELLPLLSAQERAHVAALHFNKTLEHKQERSAIFEMRRHFNHYFKSIENFKTTRLKLLTSTSADEIREILDSIGSKNVANVPFPYI